MDSDREGVAARRQWLAAVLRGGVEGAAAVPLSDLTAMLASARHHGVTALVAERLRALPDSDPLRVSFGNAAHQVAALALLRESETRKVVELLAAAGIPVLLLKGSALAWWLFPAPYLRECGDIDLLVASREQARLVVDLLSELGFPAGYDQGGLAHEQVARRELSATLNIDIDVHWRLLNSPAFADIFSFDELLAASIPLPGLSVHARGLAPAHAFLHATLHRAMNLHIGVGDGLKWLYDLHLLASRLEPKDWALLRQLCRERGLSGVFLEGIRAAAAEFGTAVPAEVLAELHEQRAHESLDASRLGDWYYMQRQNLRALPSRRAYLQWMWGRLFPPLGYLRELYGADKSTAALLLERARRLLRRLR